MSAGKIVLLIFGIIFVLASIGVVFAGAGVIWASQFHKDGEGFHVTDPMSIRSGTYAVVSDTIEIDRGASEALNWLGMDKIKVEVENDDPSLPVFIGIAEARDVDAYLSGVKHDEITSVRVFDSRYDYERRSGDVEPEAPGLQGFWLEESEGTGLQEVVFDIGEGEYTVLAMNADASEGIEVEAVFGIKSSGVVVLIGVALILTGIIILAGGIVMVIFGARGSKQKMPPAPPAQA